MADDVSKYSTSDFSESPEKSEFAAHQKKDPVSPLSKVKKTSLTSKFSKTLQKVEDVKPVVKVPVPQRESRVIHFLKKVNLFFSDLFRISSTAPQKKESKLLGRIHEFEKDIEHAINDLNQLRSELENESQPQFSFLIVSVIDPLIKEINRLEKAGVRHLTMAQQVKESKEYVDWIEKTKKWIELCSGRKTNEQAIQDAFIEYSFAEFRAKIDKDLQVIQDYLNVFLNKLEGNDLLKIELQDQLEQELSQHVFELYLLKDHPPSHSIETLNEWREEAELSREKYFSAALHVIDANIGELMQPTILDEGQDVYLVDIHIPLESLEINLIKLGEEILILKKGTSEEKIKECLANLVKMEDEAHSLNGNLHLTHEHAARVQKVIDILASYRKALQ